MSKEIKELLFLLHNDKLTEAGKRKLEQEIERLTKENKILRENAEHNDKVVDKVNWENERLNNIINESAEEILKELEENNHLSFGVALAIRQKLLDYKELKGSDKDWI